MRAEAAKLLGSFEQVSDCFLDQTLDKKLLNAMRVYFFFPSCFSLYLFSCRQNGGSVGGVMSCFTARHICKDIFIHPFRD